VTEPTVARSDRPFGTLHRRAAEVRARERGKTLFGKLFANQTIRAGALGVAFTVAFAAYANAEDADLARGEQLYALCTQCHMADGGGSSEALAPAIAGMPSWYVEMQLKNFASGIRGLHAEDTGGLRMYPMSLWLRSESDQKAVAAYVASMTPTQPSKELAAEGNAALGAGYYAVCSGCHGASAEGNQGMGAPPLAGQSDWYLKSSIEKYRDRVRGAGAGDPYGVAMQAMVGTLADDTAIIDVIAHIESLGN